MGISADTEVMPVVGPYDPRKCPRCGNFKDANQFYWKHKERKRQSSCIPCHKLYVQDHYARNTKYYLDKANRNRPVERKRRAELLARLKLSCADCGTAHPAVLEFHHNDPSKKEGLIAWMARKAIEKEAKKCTVLCANCHRIRHWDERQNGGKSTKQRFLPIRLPKSPKQKRPRSSMDRAPDYESGFVGGSSPSGVTI